MIIGTLKMYDAQRGFGFIKRDDGGPDCFLHVKDLHPASLGEDDVRPGLRVQFDLAENKGRLRAVNVMRCA
jgi:cold shock protein